MIAVHQQKDNIAEYKRLLLADWKRDFPEQILNLLWSTLNKKSLRKEEALFQLLDPTETSAFPVDYFGSLVQGMGQALRFVPLAGLPALPKVIGSPKRAAKSTWQAIRLACYMTIPAHVDLAGDVDFFRDLQALAFQAALHVVLPEIQDKNPDEHALLLNALTLFSLEYASADFAHFSYLLSMIHGYLGNNELRLRYLFAAFRFTPPEDDSYLTKAQEYWSELLDENRYAEAEKFLFTLSWWSLPAQQDEIREMIVAAIKHMQLNGRVK